MFIGRKSELRVLEKMHSTNNFELLVMYGRRRIGKTRLLIEFTKNKKVVFFSAEENNDLLNLQKFSEQIIDYFKVGSYITKFETWQHAFEFLIEQIKEERFVLVLDEFPYIAENNPSFLSFLQNLIDHKLINTKLFIIICGSSMSFIEKEILAHKSPLFGRRTGQMLIEPFDYLDASCFFPNYKEVDLVYAYGILDGIPQYLLKFDAKESIRTNIINNILNKTSYLYDEPRNLIHQELRSPAVYNSIIESIASGSTKINEIATKIGEPQPKTLKYITSLIDLKIVEKLTPILGKSKRKSIYVLTDQFFRFMYRYASKHKSLIEQERTEYVYNEKIEPSILEYLGYTFEKICIQYLIRENKNDNLPFVVEEFGKWWGNNPTKKKEEEIDIVGVGDSKTLYGECKFRNEKMGVSVYEKLKERSTLIGEADKYYYLFSKSGFTEELIRIAEIQENVKLLNLSDLFDT